MAGTPTVLEITPKHKYVVALSCRGYSNKEIGEMLGFDSKYVCNILSWEHPELDLVRQRVSDSMIEGLERLDAKFEVYAHEALNRQVQIMRGPDVTNARLASKDIMDRAGYSPIKKVAAVNTQVPSAEFVQAVDRMDKIVQVQEKKEEWSWKQPVVVVDEP